MPPATTAPSPPMPAVAPRLTAEEFAIRYAGQHVELVRGVVQEIPMAGLQHGALCARITILLGLYVETHDFGQVMSNDSFVQVGAETVRGADVVYYSYQRLPKGEAVPRGCHTVAPDLVVEIKSPSDRWGDLFAKVGEYLNAGTRVVLLLDPDTASASVYRSEQMQQIFHTGEVLTLPDVLPGFSVAVDRLFA